MEVQPIAEIPDYAGDDYDHTRALARGNFWLGALASHDKDTSWVWFSDMEAVAKFEEDFDAQLTKRNDWNDSEAVMRVPSEAHAVLWFSELLGQLSDGYWENHWENTCSNWDVWTDMHVEVDEDLDGIEIVGRTQYFDRSDWKDLDFRNAMSEYDEHLVRCQFLVSCYTGEMCTQVEMWRMLDEFTNADISKSD